MGCTNSTQIEITEAPERKYRKERERNIEWKYSKAEDPDSVIANLRTGDVILCHCDHTFGKLTQWADWTSWDHVAMAVRMSDDPNVVQERLNVMKEKGEFPKGMYGKGFENIEFNYTRPEPGQIQLLDAAGEGTFCYPLKERLVNRGEMYQYVGVRKLDPPLTEEECAKVEKFVQEAWATPYETNFMEMLKPILRKRVNIKKKNKQNETLQNLFCSELTAEALQKSGALTEEYLNSNEVVPSMFNHGGPIDKLMAMQGTHSLGGLPQIIVSPGSKICLENEKIRTSLFNSNKTSKIEEGTSPTSMGEERSIKN